MVVKVRSLVEVEKKWQVGVAQSSAAADVAHAGLLCFASVDWIYTTAYPYPYRHCIVLRPGRSCLSSSRRSRRLIVDHLCTTRVKVKHLDTSFVTLLPYLTTFYSHHHLRLHFSLLPDHALTLLIRCCDPSSRRSGATPDASDPGFRRLSHLPRTKGYSSRQHCLCSAPSCCKHSRALFRRS